MNIRPFLIAFLLTCASLIGASIAWAGGWATVQINEMPEELYAGEPFTVEFTVWQHGDKPVHELLSGDGRTLPITPQLTFTHPETGVELTFSATPMQEKGRFSAAATLSQVGAWEWQISPEPLAAVAEMPVLDVVAPPLPQGTLQSSGTAPALPGSLLLAFSAIFVLLAAGAGALLVNWRDRIVTTR